MSHFMIGTLLIGGILLIFVFGRRDSACRLVGGLVTFMGIWKLADMLSGYALSLSGAVWAYKVILAVSLVLIVMHIINKRKQS